MLESKIWKEAEKKSKIFLRQVMGVEVFDEFSKKGKIEIKSNDNIYELYYDGRIVNKTTNQNYCIVPTRPDYPTYDIIAIKYCWLKYNTGIVEKVAKKTSIYGPRTYDPINGNNARRDGVGYDAFVHYMESTGWSREQICINEKNTTIATVHAAQKGYTSSIIDVRCPTGRNMTMMGIQQVPDGSNRTVAHSFSLYIRDENGWEINDDVKIRIAKVKPSDMVVQLLRCFYLDLKLIHNIDNRGVITYRVNGDLFRWRQGIMLHGEEHFIVYIINSDITIPSKNIKFQMESDLWIRQC